eukprot:NODE_175_length_2281_cov_69.142921_g151_i0.p1 GENE.NODE_175_length_2281_cov_69.142921_g151_i0~~NODE_175_length_2281_cov_69.142921_g151_i0.p1  ORF type:complete len:727 (-),score=127.21 NODE_175_length_2281_cov_69.142921_g151_i0:100-1986(-)
MSPYLTETATWTFSPSLSQTPTLSSSPTATTSHTPSFTRSAISTHSGTSTVSASATCTPSLTQTSSGSETPTPTHQLTSTQTDSTSATPTTSQSNTATSTTSPSPSAGPTTSSSSTLSPTSTPTTSNTPTSTAVHVEVGEMLLVPGAAVRGERVRVTLRRSLLGHGTRVLLVELPSREAACDESLRQIAPEAGLRSGAEAGVVWTEFETTSTATSAGVCAWVHGRLVRLTSETVLVASPPGTIVRTMSTAANIFSAATLGPAVTDLQTLALISQLPCSPPGFKSNNGNSLLLEPFAAFPLSDREEFNQLYGCLLIVLPVLVLRAGLVLLIAETTGRSVKASMALTRFPQLECVLGLFLYPGITRVCVKIFMDAQTYSAGERSLAGCTWLMLLSLVIMLARFLYFLRKDCEVDYRSYGSILKPLPRWPLRPLLPTHYWHGDPLRDLTDICGTLFSGMALGRWWWNLFVCAKMFAVATMSALPSQFLDCERFNVPMLTSLFVLHFVLMLALRPFRSPGDNLLQIASTSIQSSLFVLLSVVVHNPSIDKVVTQVAEKLILASMAVSTLTACFGVLRFTYHLRCRMLMKRLQAENESSNPPEANQAVAVQPEDQSSEIKIEEASDFTTTYEI